MATRPPLVCRSLAWPRGRTRRDSSGKPWPTGSRSAGRSSPSRGEVLPPGSAILWYPIVSQPLDRDRGCEGWPYGRGSLAGDRPGPAGPAGRDPGPGARWPRLAPSWPRWPWISARRTWVTWPWTARPQRPAAGRVRACSTNSWAVVCRPSLKEEPTRTYEHRSQASRNCRQGGSRRAARLRRRHVALHAPGPARRRPDCQRGPRAAARQRHLLQPQPAPQYDERLRSELRVLLVRAVEGGHARRLHDEPRNRPWSGSKSAISRA